MRNVSSSVLLMAAAAAAFAGQPEPKTVQAFDRYVKEREQAMEKRANDPAHFLWSAESGSRLQRIKSGSAAVEPRNEGGMLEVPGGIIHDWTGAVFIPRATLPQVMAFAQNYDHHKDYYKPEVVNSKLLERQGETFKIFLRLLKKKVITVVYDTEHTVVYRRIDKARWMSRSVMTRSREIDDPGKPTESQVAPEEDHGFLWRLNSYWRFEERDGGVVVECEAVTLSRTVPTGTGWLVNPIVKVLPRQSLTMTLENLRAALAH